MKHTTLLLLLVLQLATVAVSLYWNSKMETSLRETQDKQFRAELQNVELKFKLDKIELQKKRGVPVTYL
jgi:hypothetical protein